MTEIEALGKAQAHFLNEGINNEDSIECAILLHTILELRVPKKPIEKNIIPKNFPIIHGYTCPNCDELLTIKHSYCYNCSQAIDWSEV